MTTNNIPPNFNISLGRLVSPALDELATQLLAVSGITAREKWIILESTRTVLLESLHGKLCRLLILELNAARVAGRLIGDSGSARWMHFLELSARVDFWNELSANYPSLPRRIERVIQNHSAASLIFAQRWAMDRKNLATLCNKDAVGELQELSFGAGDSHQSGKTVGLARCEGGRIVYKPRSLKVDAVLFDFIKELVENHSTLSTVRIPRVVALADHGWAEFVDHRYAIGDEELRKFYQGIGHWLAIMRLLGGCDFHAENMIAHRSSPVIVDCETLFTPKIKPFPSGYGQAFDNAAELIAGTVLNVGILPGRGMALGWRGVDSSAVGMLPDQQPSLTQLSIEGAGSDEAHIGVSQVIAPISMNHPSHRPALAYFWSEVLVEFDSMTKTLRRLDSNGTLRAMLNKFSDCRIRFVPRSTEVYAELGRMLWHPVSLHNEAQARKRAFQLLEKMATNVPSAPNTPGVINAEINELMVGDIPMFTTNASHGQMNGPQGTHWLSPKNLICATLRHWRGADVKLDIAIIRASLVSAYINDGWAPTEVSLLPEYPRTGELETRRRRLVVNIMGELKSSAICGQDGTVTWIAPILIGNSWSVQPLGQDLYSGISGVALLIAAYLREVAADRADAVPGLEDLFASTLRTLALAEAKRKSLLKKSSSARSLTAGAYVGFGSQIWTWLNFDRWGVDGGNGLEHACSLARDLPYAVSSNDGLDLLSGKAGAIPSLLWLAQRTNDNYYLDLACVIGDQLCARATNNGQMAYWGSIQWPHGMGGFAHGTTGIAWALIKLGRVTGNSLHLKTAELAFAFEESLFDIVEQNWLDMRVTEQKITAAAWCHGACGIGLAHLDLDPHFHTPSTLLQLRRATAATWRFGLGWNHTPCHGDMGAWELINRAIAIGEGPASLSRERLLETILTSIENHGPVCGFARDTFSPGLMAGVGGVAYQLLRAHPYSDLPSILTLESGQPLT